MTEDSILIGCVSVIWIVLAGLYAFVPMFSMPGAVLVWGSGAAVFLGLTVVTSFREARLRPNTNRR